MTIDKINTTLNISEQTNDHTSLGLPFTNNLISYVPGKPIETLAREKNLSKIIKLASNENPYGPSPKVKQAIIDNIDSINLYPDPDQYSIKNTLANFYGINFNNLTIGNGSDELIRTIIQTFVNHKHNIIAPKFSFSSYLINAQIVEAEYIVTDIHSNWQSDLQAILDKINSQTKMVCLANPNNPTGSYLHLDVIEEFLTKVPENILILLDEAYFEYIKYANNFNSLNTDYLVDHTINLLKKFNNLIILRTFSKAYGLAGLRIGYAISNSDITNLLHKVKQPFNVNRLAQIAAIAAVSDQKFIQDIVAKNSFEKNALYTVFDELNINYIRSQTNFITVNIKNSLQLYNKLLDHGIITRPLANYDLHESLRITIGNAQENHFLKQTLQNILSHG